MERGAIKSFVYPDGEGRVLGFGGLTVAPMHHRFEVGGRILWTWCAWDSLFIPGTLGRQASRHISLLARRRVRPGEKVQCSKLRAGVGAGRILTNPDKMKFYVCPDAEAVSP